MIQTLKPFILLLTASFGFAGLHAQKSTTNKPNPTDQRIIIHKKDSTKEKITVVIDGDNVTVNGKPVDDFVSDDVEITKHDIDDVHYKYYIGDDMAAIAPMPPQAKAFNEDMIRKVKTNKAFFGVMTEKVNEGARITEVTDESAAEKAGFKEDDIITKIGETKITGPDDLYKAIGTYKPGDKVTIGYLRDAKPLTAVVTLGKSEQMKVYSWNTPDADFYKRGPESFNFNLEWTDKPRLGIEAQDTEDGNGVKILDVDDDEEDASPAAKAGLKEDDIITQVNGKAVTSTEALRESLKDVKKGDTVKITYKRNNQTQTVDVKFPKELKTIDL